MRKPPIFNAPGTRRRGSNKIVRSERFTPRVSITDLQKSVTSSVPNYYNEGQIDSLLSDIKGDIQEGILRDNNFLAAFDPGNISSDLLPVSSCQYNIGSVEEQWKNLFLCDYIHLYNGGIRWVDDTQRIYFSSILGEDTLNLVAPDTILATAKIKADQGIMLGGVLKTAWPNEVTNLNDLADVSVSNPVNKAMMQWNGSSWADTTDLVQLESIEVTDIVATTVRTKYITAKDTGMDMDISDLADIKDNLNPYTNAVLGFNEASDNMDWFDAQHIDWRPPFLELTDTPSDYAGDANKYVKVNASSNALEFITFPTHTISTSTDVQTAGAANKNVLVFDGTHWKDSADIDIDEVKADIVEGTTVVKIPNDLKLDATTYDVSSLGAAQSGEVLRSAATSTDLEWVHMPVELQDFIDVNNSLSPSNDAVFVFNGTHWDASQSLDIDDITLSNTLQAQNIRPTNFIFTNGAGQTDTFVTPTDTATLNQVLRVTNSSDPFDLSWTDMSVDTLSDTDLSSSDPTNGSVLRYNGTDWKDSRNLTSLTGVTASGTISADMIQANDDLSLGGNTYDVSNLTVGSTGQVLAKGSGGSLEWKDDAETTSFLELTNTPNSWTGSANKYVKVNGSGNALSFVASAGNWDHQVAEHIIPDTDEAYDLGSAEFRFRDLYGSVATFWMGDTKLTIEDDKFKVKKRKLDQVPAIVAGLGGDSSGALTHSGESGLADMSMVQWEAYASTLGTPATRKSKDIWVAKGAAGYSDADYETIDATTSSMGGTMTSHIIPDLNDGYDIGSAEFKIRDMYVSDNSLWVGDNHKIDIDDTGKMKFKKRKKSVVPAKILALGGTLEGAEAHSGEQIEDITLAQWLAYGKTLDSNLTIQDIYPKEGDGGFTNDDWEENGAMNPEGHAGAPPVTGTPGTMAIDLHQGAQTTVVEPQDNFSVDIIGAMEGVEGKAFEVTINILQGGAPANINTSAISINGATIDISKVTAGTVLAGTPNVLNMLKINCVFVSGAWYVIITAYPHA